MRKSLLASLFSFLLSAFLVEVARAQLTSLTEGFDTTGNPVPTQTGIFAQSQPWINVNNSDVPNTTSFNWQQGDSGTFIYTAQSPAGSTTSFAQVSFLTSSGTILSDWLLTPELTLEAGATFSFYTAAVKGTTFANDLQVYISLSGSSTTVGSDAQTPTGGVFSLLPGGDLNPTLAVNGYPNTPPDGWTLETFTLTSSEVSTPTSGRIGLRYFIPNTATQGSEIGIDTFSFADPTIFTRTVSGNWTDTTGWTPSSVPNGNTVTAQLVNPSSGANSVNLGGGTFTVNQLQFSGTGAGTWDVLNGTIVFDGTNPMFVNQGGSSGLIGLLPSLQLNANTTFEIDNASAVTEVTGAISGTGQLTKTGSGALVLIGTNTYSGGTTISAGTLQIGNGGTSGSIVGNVTDNGTLAFDRSDTVAFGSVISGTGSLVQLGSGTLVLTGTNTYSGGTTISAGTLQIGNGGITGSITGNVTDNGTLAFDRSDAVTIGVVVSGTGSLVQLGSGTLTLTGNNTYTGGTTISAGTLQVGNGGATGSITGNVTDNGILAFDRSNSLTFAGAISGAGSVTQIGTGTTILTGTNTYGGGTTISSGTLQIGNGGTSGSITGNVTDNGTLVFDRSDAVTIGVVVSGAGSLVQLGGGTLILTADNTYTGGTIVNAGILQLGDGTNTTSLAGANGSNGFPGGAGKDAVTVNNSATFNVMTNASVSGGAGGVGAGLTNPGKGGEAVSFSAGGSLTNSGTISGGAGGKGSQIANGGNGGAAVSFSAGGSLTNSGTISGGAGGAGAPFGGTGGNGGAAVSFSAGGTLTNSGTISGGAAGTGVGAPNGTGGFGVLFSGAAGILTNQTGGVINGGVMMGNFANAVTLDTGSVINGVLNLGPSIAATLTLDGTGTQLYSTAVTGATTLNGALIKNGTGTWTLDESFTYTGGTTINAGTLNVRADNNLGAASGVLTFDGGTLQWGASFNLSATRAIALDAGGGAFDTDGFNTTIAQGITGSGGLTKAGAGTLTLTGINTYAGGTTISAGTLQLGNGGTSGSITGNVTDNGTLAFDRSDSVTFAGVISGTGSLVQLGSDALTLTANNTYSGGTTISAGTLQIGNGGTSGSITGNVTDNGTLAFDRSDAVTIGVVVSGTGSLVQLGSGTLTLTGNNTYTGGTTVSAGTLQLGNGGTTGSITGNVTDNGTLAFDLSDAVTFGGVISGTGSLVQLGNGTLTLTGNNTYSGGTTISAGTLHLGNGGTTGSITGNVTDNGTLAFDRSNSVTFGEVISGVGTLVQSGSGTLILTGNNTYSGGTTISAGALQIGSGGTTGSIVGDVTDNGTLAFDRSDSVTFAGVISGTGSLVQLGSGALTLTGNNTYSGGTTISAGTLQIGNGGTSGSITGNVTDNGTLAFDRSDAVTIGVVVSGTGSLVQLGSGTLTLTGNNTYTGGTTVSAGTLQLGNGGTSGSITGNVTDNGTLAFDRSDAVTFAGAISGAGSVTQIGIGRTILTGTNTYGGGTTISSGTLQLGNGGTAGSITGNVSDNGVLAFDRSDTVTFAGVIAGAGGVTQIGTGTTILTGANTYSGGTIITVGTLEAGSPSALSQNSEFTVNSFLDLHGFNSTIASLSGTGAVLNNGATAAALAVGNNNASTTFSGVLQDGTSALQLTKSGTGTLTLTGANTYSGGTTISAGTLQVGNGGATGSITGNVTDNGTLAFDLSDAVTFGGVISATGSLVQLGNGTLTLTGNNTYSGGTTISAGTLHLGNGGTTGSITGNVTDNGTLAFDRSNSVTFGEVISGVGTLVQSGSGTLILTGNNTYSGGTTISAGALQIGSGGTTGSIVGDVTDNGTLAFDRSDSVTFAGVISGAGALVQSGSGTLVLNGNNSYSGGTTISAGTLQIGNGGTTGSIIGNVIDNAALVFDRRDTVTFGGIVSGAGDLVQLGTGLILTGNNTYSGGTTISAGTLQIGNGGTSGSIVGNVIDNGNLDFSRSDSITFGGVISGTGSLVQMGSGTLTLTADNSYSGGTTINTGASLQLGNGGTTGSIIGNVTDNGSLIFNRSDNVAFNAIISGSGNLVQNGSGTTVLGGANTYAGGTIINNGTLLVNNSQALGLGNVVVNGGVLGADPQPINVKGNYTQNAGGSLQLQVAGANPGQYDVLNVGGNATLGGTLQLISLGFQPKAGNQLTLVTSGATVSGQFAHFVDPFSVRPGLNTINLIYGKQSVVLEFLNQTTPVSPVIPTVPTVPASPSIVPPAVVATINFASFALTPNGLAAAHLLDAVQLDPRAANLISFLDKEPFANLPGDFEQISPEGLTAFYEISFSNANIQRLNLESRTDDIRSGSTGFSSNMKFNGATANLENKAGVDGKSSKNVVEPILQPGPQNRWGVWVTGFGDFVNVDSDGNANGYNFTTGGFSLGVDYRISDQLAIGAMGEYAHTWAALQPRGDIDVDSGRGGLYATWFNHGFYLDGAIYGGHNTYESSRSSLGGLATGDTEGAEWSTFISGGYDFHLGHLSVGPIAALQYTYVNINGFSEKSSLAPLAIHSGSAESLRSDFGFRAFYQWQIGKILVEPSLKAAWEHEYKYSALPITAGFAEIPGPSATFFGPNEGHDSAIVSAGVSVQWTPMIATYVNYDGQLGRGNYDSNAVTGGVRISF